MAFEATLDKPTPSVARIAIVGELDASVAAIFRAKIEEAANPDLRKLVLDMSKLEYMSSAGLRVLVFAKQKMGANVVIYVVGAQPQVVEPIRQTGFHHSVYMLETYDKAVIEG